jgi:hypothetical protein
MLPHFSPQAPMTTFTRNPTAIDVEISKKLNNFTAMLAITSIKKEAPNQHMKTP